MRQTKRIFALILTVVMMATVVVLPAAADSYLAPKFATFPQQSTGSYSSGYTGAVQIYVASISDHTFSLINSGGRIDGIYAAKTKEAVYWTQKNWFFPDDSREWDGICGSGTWREIGNSVQHQGQMTDSHTGHTYDLYHTVDNYIYRIRPVGSRIEYSYYNMWGYNWTIFRTA